MKTEKLIWIWCLPLLVVLCLFNLKCTSVSTPEKTEDKAEISSIKKSFDTLSQAMVDGKLEIAYGLLSATYKLNVPYEQFVKDYNEGRNILVMRYKGASPSNISIDRNQATARIDCGTGEKVIFNFIKEDNVWKIDRRGERTIPP